MQHGRAGEDFAEAGGEGGVICAQGYVELGAGFGFGLGAQDVLLLGVGLDDVDVDGGGGGDEVEGVAVRHLVDGDLAGGGGRDGGGGAVGEHGLREGGGQDAGAGARAAHGHPDDRRAGVAQQFQYRKHVGGGPRGAH